MARIKGQGTEPDIARGVAELEKLCSDGVTLACAHLGHELWLDSSVKKDFPRAAKLLDTACRASDSVACGALGSMLDTGGSGVDRDLKRAFEARQKACRLRNILACQEASQRLHQLQAPSNDMRPFLEPGCFFGHGGLCYMLAVEHISGRFGARDMKTGVSLLQRACRAEHQRACEALLKAGADLTLKGKDLEKVRRKACDSGVTQGCS